MLEKVLEYQETEKEIIAQENLLLNSKDRTKATQSKQKLGALQSKIIGLENEAKSLNETYQKAYSKYNEYMEKLSKLEKDVESQEASENQKVYDELLKEFKTTANTLEKKIQTIHTEVNRINKEYEEIIKQSRIERETFDKFMAEYRKLKAETDPKIAKLNEKLKTLEKGIDPELLHVYKQKRENKLFPVFVELLVSKCGGCRMEVSASKLGKMKLNKFGLIECENCGRYIYQK